MIGGYVPLVPTVEFLTVLAGALALGNGFGLKAFLNRAEIR